MNAHILLIEDEPALLSILKAAISYGGFTEESVSSGKEGLEAFERTAFDAVLIDLGLPDVEGADLLRSLRESSDVPIIVVSGRGAERDKIEALDLGADDYVSKPFLPGELLARIRAALRRHRALSSRVGEAAGSERAAIQVGALRLDPFDRAVELGDRRASLSAAEFRVLRALAERPGEPVAKEALLDMLYGGDAPPETRVVEVYVSKIRRKLQDLSESELVQSVRGIGWQLNAPARAD